MPISPADFESGRQFVGEHLQPRQAFDPAEQGDVVDRLGEEVVGAGLQALYPVLGLVERRHHDDGNVVGGRVGLDAPAHLDAVDTRHHHIEQNDIGTLALDGFQRIDTVHGGDDVEIFRRELGFQQPHIGEDIVDDENTCGHVSSFRNPSIVCRKLTTEMGLEI